MSTPRATKNKDGFNVCGPEDDIRIETPFDWPTPSEPPWALHYGPHQMDMAKHAASKGTRRFFSKGRKS